MGKKNYIEKLKDPRWQKLRLEIFERDGWKCQSCGAKDKTLCVHHKAYEKGKEPWDCNKNLLITFCDECHEYEHHYFPKKLEKLGVALSMCGLASCGVGKMADALMTQFDRPLQERRELLIAILLAAGVDKENI